MPSSKRNARSYSTTDKFFSDAGAMRAHFEDRFKDPRGADAGRFVWDYWHVPGQYTALRTPAYHFFPKKLYETFHNHLVWWGRRNLGCHDVSPPWLSCYVDGCGQELHGDLPHGPWAFVYSLTPWQKRAFNGGQTLLLRDEILDYWNSPAADGLGLEEEDILLEVPPLFNRLTVFDPRVPHGVREVRGVRDPRQGRLVIHGWFVQPRPFIEGPLSTKDLQSVIDDLSGSLGEFFAQGLAVYGTLSVGFQVSQAGSVSNLRVLSNALRSPGADRRIEAALLKHVRNFLTSSRFRKAKAKSQVTLPLIFST
jgi:hypothetical protein